MEDKKVRYISRFDRDYPEKLGDIANPPAGIYVKGALPDPDRPTVAIIGSRLCSQYGRLCAESFGSALALAGVQVVSGLARGIDGISQDAACRAGGRSFGILGCGVNVVYPAANKEIYDRVLENGGLISEVPPDARPVKACFAARNRLISALCDILVVVEAKDRSGTQITVQRALEQGKDIYAVPGRITDICSEGCNELIAAGAGIASSPEKVLNALGIYTEPLTPYKKGENTDAPRSRLEKLVYEALDLYPKSINEIASQARILIPELSRILFHLCLSGIVREEGKNYYYRTEDRQCISK